ncbi:hypothetical protein EDB83DRAFT_954468 [Lactarius deliciosus]|nr:hypothetical protein EDB83DRAFT_954468 [Lactarius deliciosus]
MRSLGPIGETVCLFAFVAELVIVNIGLVGCAQRNVGSPNSRANIHHLRTPWTWGVHDGGIQQRHFSAGVIHLQMGFLFRDRPVDPYCILRYRRATVLWTSRHDAYATDISSVQSLPKVPHAAALALFSSELDWTNTFTFRSAAKTTAVRGSLFVVAAARCS